MSEPSSSVGGGVDDGGWIRVERTDPGVALVTIDRAARYNTLAVEVLEDLDARLAELARNESIAAIVLTGAGGHTFAAGADIREVGALDSRRAIEFAERGQGVLDRLERVGAFTIAAIDGYCMGGGLDLALACDARHATPASVFAHPGARLGILTGFGGTARLARVVGRARAVELFATVRRIDAREAMSWGLVDRVADDAVASALASAREVAEKWPVASSAIKGSALRWWRNGLSGR